MRKVKIKINGKAITAGQGKSVLEVATKEGIDIPALCYHPDLPVKANCRLCLIEIKGKNGLHTSCSTTIEPGMEVQTESPTISRARVTNLELIFAQHCEECLDCVLFPNCKLLELSKKYGVEELITKKKPGPPSSRASRSTPFLCTGRWMKRSFSTF